MDYSVGMTTNNNSERGIVHKMCLCTAHRRRTLPWLWLWALCTLSHLLCIATR